MLPRLEADIKTALLAGDKDKAHALSFLKSSLLAAAKDQGGELTDEAELSILRKEAKKRQEAADLFTTGGNQASAYKELYELKLIENYLPAQKSEGEIEIALKGIVEKENLPKDMSSMGKLIGMAKSELGAEADPSVIARIASNLLKQA